MKSKDRRIDVMLSSTSRDLPDHREQATEAVLRSGMHPIIMETLTASLGDAISESLKMVDEAEIYIGIFGMRYGYIPDDPRNPQRLSVTEMEYRHALQRGIPVLIFIMSGTHPGPATAAEGKTFYEQEKEGQEKLEALKKELTTKHVVGFFDSPADLRAHIIQALGNPDVKAKAYRIAGIDTSTPAPPEKTPLPTPPEFYADPPYTLTSEFIGRTDELRRLDAWAASDDPLLIVEAIGGMGKSAVTWEWVKNHADKLGFDGIVWWSFYESGATMAAFVRHALAYITRQDPDALKSTGMKENFRDLLQALRQGRYLLVLDGLERALVAYHRWNAAQMRDDTVEEAESIIKDRDIRACTDPRDDDVLRGLLACNPSKVLISSRLLPLALEDRDSTLYKGVTHVHLNGLAPEDALALTRAAGVTVADERRFGTFMAQFGYHSLLVKLVAGRVLKFRRGPGDFDRWYTVEGRTLHVSDFDLKQSQTHILGYALDGLDAGQRRFLSQVAAFGDAVPYDTLAVFNPYVRPRPQKPSGIFTPRVEREQYQKEFEAYQVYEKSPEYLKALSQFDELLTELEERGLLRWDREKDTYDMHPVVRGTVFDELEGEAKTMTFERIRGHFEALPAEDVESAKTVADLTNTIAIYRALVGAGKWDEAARFFVNRLRDRLGYNIAAYYTIIELLTPLFSDGTDTLPHLSDPANQSNIVTSLAGMFYYIGRNDESLVLTGLNLKINIDNDDLGNLISGLLNYANSLCDDNQLALAQRVNETALALAQATDNQNQTSMSTLFLLGIYRNTDQWEEAEAAYAFLQEHPPHEIFWQADVEKYYAETLIYRGLDAGAALDKAESLAIRGNNALIFRQVKGLRGEAALAAGDFTLAARHFEESIQLYRQSGSSFTDWVLGGLARAYANMGEHNRAREIIEQGINYIDAAEVYLIIGDHEKAREYALQAYEAAWADGPPYVWWWGLERAKAVLDALGEPYPDLPPYDPAKIGKFPYQDEIEALIEREQAKRAAEKEAGEGE
ncbi:MAG: DUF4062 domain-containing protein [Anaerolineaceae bacterium]|nr:DUF4062 domain-containing protein [Anaerolineaceae bacterium]